MYFLLTCHTYECVCCQRFSYPAAHDEVNDSLQVKVKMFELVSFISFVTLAVRHELFPLLET